MLLVTLTVAAFIIAVFIVSVFTVVVTVIAAAVILTTAGLAVLWVGGRGGHLALTSCDPIFHFSLVAFDPALFQWVG